MNFIRLLYVPRDSRGPARANRLLRRLRPRRGRRGRLRGGRFGLLRLRRFSLRARPLRVSLASTLLRAQTLARRLRSLFLRAPPLRLPPPSSPPSSRLSNRFQNARTEGVTTNAPRHALSLVRASPSLSNRPHTTHVSPLHAALRARGRRGRPRPRAAFTRRVALRFSSSVSLFFKRPLLPPPLRPPSAAARTRSSR